MKRIFFFTLAFVFLSSAAFLLAARPAAALSEGNAYLAAVQVKVYEVDGAGYFVLAKTGTGALIDNNGTLLTSRSLIADPARAAVSVCLPTDLNQKTVCRWAADIISCGADADFPLCLWRLRTVAGLSDSQNNFLFLKRQNAGWPVIGARLRMINFNQQEILETAVAYVSGSATEAGYDWLELDRAFAAGTDGGLLVNRDGELVALGVALDQYQLADQGHGLFLPPLNDWFLNESSAPAAAFAEAGRFDDFLRRQNLAADQAEFSSADPSFRIVRPATWRFFYRQENQLLAIGPAGGQVEIGWEKEPGFSDLDYLSAINEAAADGYQFLADGELGGRNGKNFINGAKQSVGRWLMPGRDYLLTINYNEGDDEADQFGLTSIFANLILSYAPFVASAPAGETVEGVEKDTAPAGEESQSPAEIVPSVGPIAAPVAPTSFLLGSQMKQSLVGRILLRVEENGEAWYLCPIRRIAYFLGRPADAFQIMRDQGLGISNADLAKIPVGQTTDKITVQPAGAFAAKHLGKIFLAVETKGEAWYVHPDNGRRYFLGDPSSALAVMRALSLGISEADFARLTK